MSKKVKCKKCHLEYNKKVYECPYCHKTRFNPTGLIIILILIITVLGIVIFFNWSSILSTIKQSQNITKFEKNGVVYEITRTTYELAMFNDDTFTKQIITIQNKSNVDVYNSINITIYQDDYQLKTDCMIVNLQPQKFTEKIITYNPRDVWTKTEIYGNFNGTSELMFVLYNTAE